MYGKSTMTHRKTIKSSVRHGSGSVWQTIPFGFGRVSRRFPKAAESAVTAKGTGSVLQNEFPPIDCVSGDKLTQTYYTTP